MSLDNVLPMSLDNSVTYVPERFGLAFLRLGERAIFWVPLGLGCCRLDATCGLSVSMSVAI
jgi:hypothetical protein